MRTDPDAPTVSSAQEERVANGAPLHWGPWLDAIVFLLFLSPAMVYVPGTGSRRLEELLLVLLLGIVAVRFTMGVTTRVSWGPWQVGFLGFGAVVLLSMLAGALQGLPAGRVDLFQLFRIGKYVAIYTVTATVVHTAANPSQARRRVLYTITIASLALVPIVIQQYFDLFGLNEFYVTAVAKPNQANDLLTGDYATRVIGMIGNPNELGFLYALAGILTVYLIITSRRRRPYLLLALALQVTALLMSLSRGALLGLGIGIVYLVLTLPSPLVTLGARQSRRRVRRVVWLGIVVTAVFIVLVNDRAVYDAVLWRFALLGDVAQDSSWTGRLLHWRENLDLFRQSPWIGVGPLFGGNFQFAGDNEWLTLLRSYGILGTLYLVAVLVGPHAVGATPSEGEALRSHRRVVEAVLLATAAYMIPAAVFHSMALMPVVLVILASEDTTSRMYILGK